MFSRVKWRRSATAISRPINPGKQPPSELTDAANATSVGATFAGEPTHYLTTGQIIALTAIVVIPAIVVPIATRGSHPSPAPTGGCKNLASAC